MSHRRGRLDHDAVVARRAACDARVGRRQRLTVRASAGFQVGPVVSTPYVPTFPALAIGLGPRNSARVPRRSNVPTGPPPKYLSSLASCSRLLSSLPHGLAFLPFGCVAFR